MQGLKIPEETVASNEGSQYGIRFANAYAVDCFKSYNAHKCQLCFKEYFFLYYIIVSRKIEMIFPVFAALNQHMSQAHKLSFCYICTANINILTKDRKFYSRYKLLQHMNGKDSNKDGFNG